MSPVTARALRRAAIAGGALAATLIGHVLTVGNSRVLPIAPFLWLGALALAILPGITRPGPRAFRSWSPARLFVTLLAGQAGLHLLLHGAPWALGLGVHHHANAPLLSPGVVMVHLTIALLLLVGLCFGQVLLVRALAIARALFTLERPRALVRPSGELPRDVWTTASQWRRGPRSSRGPPVRALPRAGSGRTPAPSSGRTPPLPGRPGGELRSPFARHSAPPERTDPRSASRTRRAAPTPAHSGRQSGEPIP